MHEPHVFLGWLFLLVANAHGIYFIAYDELFNQHYNIFLYAAIVIGLVGMALWSHYVTIKADPGHLPHKAKTVIKKLAKESNKPKAEQETMCSRCNADRTNFLPRVHHCGRCWHCCY